jgi:integrase
MAPWTKRLLPMSEAARGVPLQRLRQYLTSLLIRSGLDVKVVQHRLRHGSAKTTLDTYGHVWPDSDESARAAVGAVLAARGDWLGTERADLR